MLDRLLESKSRRTRSSLGVVTSVGAHLTIIVVAIHATAQSRPRPAALAKAVVISFIPKASPSRSASPHPEQRKVPRVPIRPYITIDPKLSELPPMDFTPRSTALSDFTKGIGSISTSSSLASTSPGAGSFNADQVEKQVTLLFDAPVPSYPEALRAAGVEGKVVAQFVVDERGRVETDSVRFLQSDNVLFEASVRTVLRRMRFAPAEIAGKTVRQLVQMPFVFRISGR